MIERPLSPDDPYGLVEEQEIEILPELPEEGVEMHDDGSMTITLEKGAETMALSPEHDANLAEDMPEKKLQEISDMVMEAVEADKTGRAEWERAYIEGMEYLGVSEEERTMPWNGASGVFHPLLMEAVVRFQSQAMQEIYPPAGPAKTRIIGKDTAERKKLAMRVQDELNYQLTQKMTEYRGETERLLFRLALAGSCFRKIYYDPLKQRPRSMFVPAEDFLVPYGESELSSAERFTHVLRPSKNDIKRAQVSGHYRDIELSDPTLVMSDVEDKKAEITGVEPVSPASDRYTVYECHMDLDLGEDDDGLPLPYVVCVEESSREILSIRRNWKEKDQTRDRCSWFVAYEYVPGMGFYGLGLIHLIGGIAKSATSIMRQLIDAGTLSNLPGGLKSRNLRIRGDDTPIRPGEFRDVDVGSGKVADAITFLPYKEPSNVLYQLLQQLVEEGRRVGSIAEIDVGDMSGEAPVGTTLALLERAQKVMSAVQARLHASVEKELKLIACVIRDDMGPEYDYDPDKNKSRYNRNEDFANASVDIIPVSDPGATTMSQRVVQHQAAVQMASQAPQLYDMPKLHRVGLEILGIKDAAELVPSAEEMKPADPVSENMAILQGKPVKAFLSQDHDAHLAVHMAAAQDPMLQQMIGQSPQASMIAASMQAHIAEHLAFQYRARMEAMMGVALPPPGEELDPKMEAELARAMAPAAQQMLAQNQQQAAQQKAQAIAEDPLVQLQTKELALKEAEIARKTNTDAAKLEVEARRAALSAQVEMARIAAQQETAGAQIGAKVVESARKLENDADMARLSVRGKEQ